MCEGSRERANGKKREMVKWSFIIAKWLWTGCTRLLLVRNGLRSYTTCTYGWVYERESGGTNKVVLWICFHVRGVILQYVCGWPFSHNIHHWMQKKNHNIYSPFIANIVYIRCWCRYFILSHKINHNIVWAFANAIIPRILPPNNHIESYTRDVKLCFGLIHISQCQSCVAVVSVI